MLTDKQRELLEKLKKERAASAGASTAIPRRDASRDARLTHAQERLWFLEQFEPGNPAYNIAVKVRMQGPLNTDWLRESIDSVIRRQAILRTAFVAKDGQPVQEITDDVLWELKTTDLGNFPPEKQQQTLNAAILATARTRFDLSRPPLFRIHLLKTGEDEHWLVVAMHHIISDAGAFAIFFREISSFYNGLSGNSKADVPDLPVQFSDVAEWERQRLETDGETLLNYWRTQLSDDAGPLNLPFDRPRPLQQTYDGEVLSAELSATEVQQLQTFAREENVTLFMLLLSALNILLYRYTGQITLTIGSSFDTRSSSETQNLMGFFQNTLVLRSRLSPEMTVRELLQSVRATVLDALEHKDIPFAQLIEKLQPQRQINVNPFFQVAFFYQNTPERTAWQNALVLPGIVVDPQVIHTKTAKFDLTFGLEERENGLQVVLEYHSGLFDEPTVRNIKKNFLATLQKLPENAAIALSKVPVLHPAALAALMRWNATEQQIAEKHFLQVYEKQIIAHADKTAVTEITDPQRDGISVSYAEVAKRSTALADVLHSAGVRPADVVGLFLDRGIDALVSILAIWKCGAAYLPLDPAFPEERLRFMMDDSGTRWLITNAATLKHQPWAAGIAGVTALNLDEMRDGNAGMKSPAVSPHSKSLAYMIYTSGSTGKPKGVRIQHAALANFLHAMRRQPGFDADDRLLSVTTLSFDISILELLLPLVSGGELVTVTKEISGDGARLAEVLARVQPSVMQATPATWRMLLDAKWKGSPALKILCGGEPLPPGLAGALLPNCRELWNMYGPTETTIWSAVAQVTVPDDIFLGLPIANTRFLVLDAQCHLLPVGAEGELYIGGAGLAEGYHHRDELTAERFVELQFSEYPALSGRYYRTGDRVRQISDGRLEFRGRGDHQVKIRGFRIETGEIEAALSDHPQVKAAVVTAREYQSGDRRLIGYYVPHQQPAPRASELRRFLAERLPDYMIPSYFVDLPAFPQTPNGKIDRNALPDPGQNARQNLAEPPATAMEKQLAGIWKQLLEIPQVNATDNFFDIGGHSLMTLRLIDAVEQQTGFRLTPRDLLLSNLRQIATRCEQFALPKNASAESGLIGKIKKIFG